jgi:hypothetical protein
MCIYYALALWKRKGGKLLLTFQPGFHVMVCSPSGIFHGTSKGGKWHVEQIDPEAFTRWLIGDTGETKPERSE